MKIKVSFVLIVILITITISGCGSIPGGFGSSNSQGSTGSSGTAGSNEAGNGSGNIADIVTVFTPPAKVTEIDFDADDPSNDDIKFVFDAAGRITYVFYSVNGYDVSLGYVYDGEAVDDDVSLWIIGLIDDIVVADERLSAKNIDFDASLGFVEYKGYFIKGFDFP